MSALVKLNLTAGVDTEIYAVEYNRINGEMEDLRSKRSVVTQAEIVRRETLEKVWEIARVQGIRIPAHILKQCGIDKRVKIEVNGNKITLTPARAPRQGWEEAFKKAASRIHEDDSVIYDDSIDLDKLEEHVDGHGV